MTKSLTRRLAAILAADIAGYSRLMREDEDRTLAALADLRRDTFDPCVARHRGRIVKSMGDGWLVAFDAAADALACGVAIQSAAALQGQIRLRVGLHVGDVVQTEDDLFGDGVNIAARLEKLASPGAVLISEEIHRLTARRAPVAFRDLGSHMLKNIADPVTVFGWASETAGLARLIADPGASPARTGLPSVHVAPLVTAGDPQVAAPLADDFRYELIHLLSRRTGIRVLSDPAENSTPDYRLTGRCRVSGGRARLDIALTFGHDGAQIWSDRFDGPADDADTLVANVARRVSTTFRSMTTALTGQGYADTPDDLLSVEQLLSKASHHAVHYDRNHQRTAHAAIVSALKRAPENPMANAMLAASTVQGVYSGVAPHDAVDAATVMGHANRAISLAPGSDFVWLARAQARLWLLHDHEGARADAEQALRVNADFIWAGIVVAVIDLFTGQPDRAARQLKTLIPELGTDPVVPICMACLSLCHLLLGDDKAAAQAAREASERGPSVALCQLPLAIINGVTAVNHAAIPGKLELDTGIIDSLPFTDPATKDWLRSRAHNAGISDPV